MVAINPADLKSHLMRNRLNDGICTNLKCTILSVLQAGDCMIFGVICLTPCESYGGEYINETAGPFYVRVDEYLEGKN